MAPDDDRAERKHRKEKKRAREKAHEHQGGAAPPAGVDERPSSARGAPEPQEMWQVRLRGLPFSATAEDVRAFLEPKLHMADAAILVAKKNVKVSRLKPGELRPGEATVSLRTTRSAAMRAAELNKAELSGRWIEVEVAEAAEAASVMPPARSAGPRAHGVDGAAPGRHGGAASGAASGGGSGGGGGGGGGGEQDADDDGSNEIFIKYLPPWTTEEQLAELFAECGEMTGPPTLMKDSATGKCKGVGWITFASAAGRRAALAWNGSEFGGRHLDISKAKVRPGAPKGTVQAPGTHTPALLADVLRELIVDPDGVYVDATFGRGGHTRAMLARLSARGRLHAFDLDPDAIAAGRALEAADPRFRIHHAPFSTMASALAHEPRLSGVLMDIGISSPQLDEAARGFRPEQDGPLDLRFDLHSGVPAWQFLRTVPRDELVRILRSYGEEDRIAARRIADAIVLARDAGTLPTRTRDFAELVRRTKGREYQAMHPAKPTFQALRIHLNDELGELRRGLGAALEVLREGARVGVISWKHLECRALVDFVRMHELAREELPLLQWARGAHAEAVRALPTRAAVVMDEPVRPSAEELRVNSRARSAVLHLLRRQSGVRVAELERTLYPLCGWGELPAHDEAEGGEGHGVAPRQAEDGRKKKKSKKVAAPG